MQGVLRRVELNIKESIAWQLPWKEVFCYWNDRPQQIFGWETIVSS